MAVAWCAPRSDKERLFPPRPREEVSVPATTCALRHTPSGVHGLRDVVDRARDDGDDVRLLRALDGPRDRARQRTGPRRTARTARPARRSTCASRSVGRSSRPSMLVVVVVVRRVRLGRSVGRRVRRCRSSSSLFDVRASRSVGRVRRCWPSSPWFVVRDRTRVRLSLSPVGR